MRYAIVGPGRMGRAIKSEASARGHECVASLGRGKIVPRLNSADLAGAEVAFEFTTGRDAESNVVALLDARVSVICGTTGWSPSAEVSAALERGGAACVLAPNFSIGMLLFSRLVERAAVLFGRTGLYDCWIHESHHRHKQDAPSGTALRLARIVDDARASETAGSESQTPQITATRAGHDPGRHLVGFDGAHDRITLEHEARGRAGFALGAVLAAECVAGKRGMLSMQAVVDELLQRAGSEKGNRT